MHIRSARRQDFARFLSFALLILAKYIHISERSLVWTDSWLLYCRVGPIVPSSFLRRVAYHYFASAHLCQVYNIGIYLFLTIRLMASRVYLLWNFCFWARDTCRTSCSIWTRAETYFIDRANTHRAIENAELDRYKLSGYRSAEVSRVRFRWRGHRKLLVFFIQLVNKS